MNELTSVALDDPEFIEINAINLQIITEVGNYFEAAPNAWQALAKSLTENELSDNSTCLFFGIGHDDPHHKNVVVDKVRFSAGVSMAASNDKLTFTVFDHLPNSGILDEILQIWVPITF